MSHFAVAVRVPRSVSLASLEDEVAKMLAPFQENNMGDCPREYMEFHGVEAEHRESYETDMRSMIALPGGERLSAYDERFKNPKYYALDFKANEPKWVYPDGHEKIEIPIKECYAFDEYVAEYCGYEKDAEAGKYGYWENPNKKWDWFVIGGRWGGHLRVKDGVAGGIGDGHSMGRTEEQGRLGHADYCRLDQLDTDAYAVSDRADAEKFWSEWSLFVDGHEFKTFEGPRDKALRLGLVDCKNADELTGAEWRTVKWNHQLRPGVDRFDVLTLVSREEAIAKYLSVYAGVHTYAMLDSQGWHAPGKMGWFACSSETVDEKAAFSAAMRQQLKDGDQRDWLVIVDCHI